VTPKSRVLVVFLFDTINLVVIAVWALGFTAGWSLLGRRVLWVMVAAVLFALGWQLLTLAHLAMPTELREQGTITGLAQDAYMSQTQTRFRRLLATHAILVGLSWIGLMVFAWLLFFLIGKPKPFFDDSLTTLLAAVSYLYFARSWDIATVFASTGEKQNRNPDRSSHS